MGSLMGDWPSYDPHNFSQIRPSDPSAQPSKLTPAIYHPIHNRTVPPPNQVITTEARNILLRQIYQKAEEKIHEVQIIDPQLMMQLRPKRAATDHLTPEHDCKQPRGALSNDP
ncbi:uncharacterized protein LOC110032994 isoform X1 [Phalaenopsis equestris]|uniref:uncharacterized protein LOC110032994 isoform X1 n=1 Tax=Phalaenopsis equestris TaxID=78828 RepID=UPI0009E1A2ED|nr:uncharacterized protein LOC110032994 isoform X1 [Phalaenopsis equestris]